VRLGAICIIASALILVACAENEAEEEQEATSRVASVERDAGGNIVLTLDQEDQNRAGIETSVLEATTHQREVVAYGSLAEDPSQAYSLRAPVTGVLTAAESRSWPAVGEQLANGEVVGLIQPRLSVPDRVTLEEREAQARSEVETSEAALQTANAAYERARTLNADNKNVSDRALQEAEERLTAAKAQLAAAQRSVEIAESALSSEGAGDPVPLVVNGAGEVVELLARPGEDVQAGSTLLRAGRFDVLLASVFLPAADDTFTRTPRNATLVPVGFDNARLSGELTAVTASGAPQLQGRTLLYRISSGALGLRPGQAITAYLPAEEEASPGVVVPQAAVVRHSGATFVYVERADGSFVRSRLPELDPVQGGYFVTGVLQVGDRVVSAGAQVLLGEEMKTLISVDEEE